MGTWAHKPLGEVCSLEIGGTPSRDNLLYWDRDNSSPNYWVSIADLHTPTITETAERITDLGIRHSNAKLFKKGTVLLSFKLTIGRVSIAGRDLYTNEAIAGLTSDAIDHLFLYYGLQYWNLLKNVDQAIKGVTLNKRKLKKIDTFYPVEKKEQQKIAEVLANYDLTIAQTEALIAKHQRIKTGLMQDLLTRGIDEHGQLRDPSTIRFKPSPLGMIPEEWEVKTVDELCHDVCVGIVIKPTQYYVNNGVPALRSANVQPNFINSDNLVYISEKSNRILSKSMLREGDVVSVRTGYPGTSAVVTKEFNGVNCIDLIISKPKPEILPKYLSTWVNSAFGKNQVLKSQGGLAQQHFNVGQMKKLIICKPDVKEQERILKVLDTQDLIISNQESRLKKLVQIKTGLMQDLLSGRVSVAPLVDNNIALCDTQKENLLRIQGNNQNIVIGVPHHSPLGVTNLPCPEHPDADENAGFIGVEVARLLDCHCIIACNSRKDPNKDKETAYSQQILSWKPTLLIEIHGHGGKFAKFDIEISCGIVDRNNWSLDLEDKLRKKMAIEPLLKDFTISGDFNQIHFKASKSYTITPREWVALHLELPKALREAPEIYLPFCRILAESVNELMEGEKQ
jgi:type I restriction enzyme S subunit